MHLFVRAYSISNSQLLHNCFVVSEGLGRLLFGLFVIMRLFLVSVS